jgi:hypothetical protein
VLSREEVRRILALIRIPVYRACLTTIYACGLRLLEGTHLQVPDVDSARLLLHIHGKSKKDRYVPLPCAKVRYYGLCSSSCRTQLEQARTLLGQTTANSVPDTVPDTPLTGPLAPASPAHCPHCQLGQLFDVRVLPPQRKVPP